MAIKVADEAAPVLDAYADGDGYLQVWCPHCHGWHFHGQGDGHRVAHCSQDSHSPYADMGYILRCVGPMTEAVARAHKEAERARREALRRHCPHCGQAIAKKATWCRHCGAQLGSAARRVAQGISVGP